MRPFFSIALFAALALSPVGDSFAAGPLDPESGSGDPSPDELDGVDVEEKLGESIPLDLSFRDSSGRAVRLADVLADPMPTILTFNYSSCPLLCSVQLSGLVETVSEMRRSAGETFRIVTVGLNPAETPKRAQETKEGYLARVATLREATGKAPMSAIDDGWTFLVGDQRSVRALADAVGFGYVYHPGKKQYLHPAAMIMLTPTAEIAHYVYGVKFDAEAIEGAVTAAGLGVTTESIQQFILSCYHYESLAGFNAFRLMQVIGIAFGAAVVVAIAFTHLRSRRKLADAQLLAVATALNRTENRA